MSDPIREYQAALREYEKSKVEAAAKIKFINKVSSGLSNYVTAFMHLNYGAPTASRESYVHRDYRVDMNEWPDMATLARIFGNWISAYKKVKDAWEIIPTQERVGLSEPPDQLRTT